MTFRCSIAILESIEVDVQTFPECSLPKVILDHPNDAGSYGKIYFVGT